MEGEKSINGVYAIEIPSLFHSSDSEKHFDRCMVCEKYLLEEGTDYMIEKSIRQFPDLQVTEVIFEYAICMDCAIQLNESMSKETRQGIADYFSRCENLHKRQNQFSWGQAKDVKPLIERCALKDTLISDCMEYQIIGQCSGTHLLLAGTPMAISHAALDEMADLMSAESLGEIDGFIGKYFTGPPEIAELLKRKLIFV